MKTATFVALLPRSRITVGHDPETHKRLKERTNKKERRRESTWFFYQTKQGRMWIFEEIFFKATNNTKTNHLFLCRQLDSCRQKWARDYRTKVKTLYFGTTVHCPLSSTGYLVKMASFWKVLICVVVKCVLSHLCWYFSHHRRSLPTPSKSSKQLWRFGSGPPVDPTSPMFLTPVLNLNGQ